MSGRWRPPPPPPPTHTHIATLHMQYTIHTVHIHYTYSTHAYSTIQSSVRKMLACQENRDPPPPPHTHTHTLHILYTCIQYYTVIRQENACLSGRWRPPPPTHIHYTYSIHAYSTIQSSVRKNACLSGRWRPPTHIATLHMQYTTHTVHMHTVLYSHLSGKCLLVRKMETPPPPPPTHTHSYATHAVHYAYSTHAYSTIQSSVRKMLACQEDGDPPPPPPPHTHTHSYATHAVHYTYSTHTLHIQYTCIQYYTVICQENACLSGK